LFYFGIGLECASPILETLYHCQPENPIDRLTELFKKYGLIYGKTTFKQFLKIEHEDMLGFHVQHGNKGMRYTFSLEYIPEANAWSFWCDGNSTLSGSYHTIENWFKTLDRVLDFNRLYPWIQVNRNYY